MQKGGIKENTTLRKKLKISDLANFIHFGKVIVGKTVKIWRFDITLSVPKLHRSQTQSYIA